MNDVVQGVCVCVCAMEIKGVDFPLENMSPAWGAQKGEKSVEWGSLPSSTERGQAWEFRGVTLAGFSWF